MLDSGAARTYQGLKLVFSYFEDSVTSTRKTRDNHSCHQIFARRVYLPNITIEHVRTIIPPLRSSIASEDCCPVLAEHHVPFGLMR